METLRITLENTGGILDLVTVEIEECDDVGDVLTKAVQNFINKRYNIFAPGDMIKIGQEYKKGR